MLKQRRNTKHENAEMVQNTPGSDNETAQWLKLSTRQLLYVNYTYPFFMEQKGHSDQISSLDM